MSLVGRQETPASVGVRQFIGLRLGLLYGPAIFGVTAAGVALNDLQRDLQVSPTAAAAVLSSHALGLGVGTVVFSRVADTWGVRRSLGIGAVFLVAGTLLCLIATALWTLVAGRLTLAIGSGAMASSALILAAAAAANRQAGVLEQFGGVLATFSGAATLIGAVVTGWSWRAAVVLPALAVVALPWCRPRHHDPRLSRRRFDVAGAGLLISGSTAVLVLVQSASWGLPPIAMFVLTGVAAACLFGLRRHVRKQPDGFVPRNVIGDRPLLALAVAGAGVYAGMFAALYAIPHLLMRHHGFTVVQVGLALLPGAAAAAVLSTSLARVSARIGVRRLVVAASTAFAGALVGAGSSGNAALLIAATSLAFLAFTVTQFYLTSQVAKHVAAHSRGAATGIITLGCFLGGAVGSATCAAMWGPLGALAALTVMAAFPIISAGTVMGSLATRTNHPSRIPSSAR